MVKLFQYTNYIDYNELVNKPLINKVVVEGLNKIKKHLKPRYTGQNGSIEEVEAPIHVSNVKKIEETQKAKKAKTTSKKSEKKAS